MKEGRARLFELPKAAAVQLRRLAAARRPQSLVLLNGTGEADRLAITRVLVSVVGCPVERVPIARVVSKYIGETEKNITRLLVNAEREGALLLFDEADALFGRRSEVRDSHDRYANRQANHLLAMMEQYDGVVLLATNERVEPDIELSRHLFWVIDA